MMSDPYEGRPGRTSDQDPRQALEWDEVERLGRRWVARQHDNWATEPFARSAGKPFEARLRAMENTGFADTDVHPLVTSDIPGQPIGYHRDAVPGLLWRPGPHPATVLPYHRNEWDDRPSVPGKDEAEHDRWWDRPPEPWDPPPSDINPNTGDWGPGPYPTAFNSFRPRSH